MPKTGQKAAVSMSKMGQKAAVSMPKTRQKAAVDMPEMGEKQLSLRGKPDRRQPQSYETDTKGESNLGYCSWYS